MIVPEYITKALERGFCVYKPETIIHELPPGGYLFKITPLENRFGYLIFCITRSGLEPAGISQDILMYTRGMFSPSWVKIPWLHSVIDFPQPVHELATWPQPFEYIIVNLTGVTQKFDITLHGVEFPNRASWDKYRAMREEIASILEAVRR